MITRIEIAEKSFGDKKLYKNLSFTLQENEKVGLIGRNGTGKTTLFHLITGADKDFDGEITIKKSAVVVSSRQEHHGFENTTILTYILADLPEYKKLKHILETYPETMGDNQNKLHTYSDALERFTHLGYFEIENDVEHLLSDYQLEKDIATTTLGQLSGGQKRLVELVKIQRSRADLALIDEPTNHMDYAAKATFIEWLKVAPEAVLVITHDRDVLASVDRIIEIRDGKALNFKGNYKDYLKANTSHTTSLVNEYETTQRRITNLKSDIIRFRRLKEKSRDPGTIHRFKSLEQRATKELAELSELEKPSFWIDRESAGKLGTKMSEAYSEHKTRNIRIRTVKKEASRQMLLDVHELALGYGEQLLFNPVTFRMHSGEKLQLHGRNGAGKTTIVKAILASVAGEKPEANIFSGVIEPIKQLRIGVYEQEIDTFYLSLSLHDAIEHLYKTKGLFISEERIKQLLSDYLFNPHGDGETLLSILSGGQKARFQLIAMLASNPQLLILDEPTNHLDLPSIEELEDALRQYHGAILYISHDSYFTKNLSGSVSEVKPVAKSS